MPDPTEMVPTYLRRTVPLDRTEQLGEQLGSDDDRVVEAKPK
ncbi:hypothetical protein [Novipirellula rosea]